MVRKAMMGEARVVFGRVRPVGLVQSRSGLESVLLDGSRAPTVASKSSIAVVGRSRCLISAILGDGLLLSRRHPSSGGRRTSLKHGDRGCLGCVCLDQSGHSSNHEAILLELSGR